MTDKSRDWSFWVGTPFDWFLVTVTAVSSLVGSKGESWAIALLILALPVVPLVLAHLLVRANLFWWRDSDFSSDRLNVGIVSMMYLWPTILTAALFSLVVSCCFAFPDGPPSSGYFVWASAFSVWGVLMHFAVHILVLVGVKPVARPATAAPRDLLGPLRVTPRPDRP